MMGISFLSPWRLLLLFVVVVLGIIYALFQKRRSKYAVRFTNLELLESIAPNRPGWRRHIAAAVQLVALAALVLAFAQPVHDVKVPRERATVMLALDVSLSMEATDVKPDRIEAAKAAGVAKQSELNAATAAHAAALKEQQNSHAAQIANVQRQLANHQTSLNTVRANLLAAEKAAQNAGAFEHLSPEQCDHPGCDEARSREPFACTWSALPLVGRSDS